MNLLAGRYKIIIQVVINIIVIYLALFVGEIRKMSPLLLLVLILAFAIIQALTGDTIELIKERIKNQQLSIEKQNIIISEAETKSKLTELQEVIVSFLEYSEIYREKIKSKLKIDEDYICLIKSSEGLSTVFTEMEDKEMLPFTSILMSITGTIRPFERMGLFLIPISSLPGVNEWNLRSYINSKIIPMVEKERIIFLKKTTRQIAKKADPLSYKYIAFFLRRGTIVYDVKNRKFNREFNSFLIQDQTSENISLLKEELSNTIKVKEILTIVNWSSFAKLNREQKVFVDKYQHIMSKALKANGIETLSHVSKSSPETLLNAIWPVIKRHTTKKKILNILKRIIDGTSFTIDVLKRNGVII